METGEQILNAAVIALNAHFKSVKMTIESETVVNIDGQRLTCVMCPNLRTAFISRVQAEVASGKLPQFVLLVTMSLTRGMLELVKAAGLNAIDTAGNCHIDIPSTLIHIEGIPGKRPTSKRSLQFRLAGVKVLYWILVNNGIKIAPFHALALQADASTSTVKHVVDTLMDHGYILRTENGYFIKNRQALIDLWVDMYNKTARPRLLKWRMNWRDRDVDWQRIKWPDMTVWGGECGAYLLNGYMTPGQYEIYTPLSMKEIMNTGLVVPDETGCVTIYQKFWNDDADAANPLVLYADLINQGDGRSLEAANILRNEALGDNQ